MPPDKVVFLFSCQVGTPLYLCRKQLSSQGGWAGEGPGSWGLPSRETRVCSPALTPAEPEAYPSPTPYLFLPLPTPTAGPGLLYLIPAVCLYLGFPGGASGKEPACQCRRRKRCRFDPWVAKIPWRRVWQPTPVFLPGESPWTEQPAGLQSMEAQRVGHD